jgi:hypothetical protein
LNTLDAYRNHLGEMAKYGSALSVLGWDQQTYMPPKGVGVRSGVRGLLSKKQFELLVSDELGKYLAGLRKADGLSAMEQASVRRVGKRHDRNRAIPPQLVEERSIAESQAPWATDCASTFRWICHRSGVSLSGHCCAVLRLRSSDYLHESHGTEERTPARLRWSPISTGALAPLRDWAL